VRKNTDVTPGNSDVVKNGRSREGGDFGYVAKALKEYYRRSGIVVGATATALSVDVIVSGRLKP